MAAIEMWAHLYGKYEVSSSGTVRRLDTARIIRPYVTHRGYLRVRLLSDGVLKNFTIHRSVARAFIGECPEGLQVNHMDGNKLNNDVSNLEYVTNRENAIHAHANGLCRASGAPRNGGQSNGRAILSNDDVKAIRLARAAGASRSELSAIYGISTWTISGICTLRLRANG